MVLVGLLWQRNTVLVSGKMVLIHSNRHNPYGGSESNNSAVASQCELSFPAAGINSSQPKNFS